MSFAPLAFKLFFAARQNAVLRRSSFPSQYDKGADSNRTTAIILLKTPYAIGFVVALFLHLLLPEDKEEEEEEDSGKEMKVDPVEA